MTALNTQVDGDHYKRLSIQPLELAYAIGATPCFTKLAKYALRDKGDRIINIDKAIHVIGIEQEIVEKAHQHIMDSYPQINKEAGRGLAFMLIDIYTQEELVRTALKAMFNQDYRTAIQSMEKYKEQIREQSSK